MAQVKIQLGSKEYNKAWIDILSSTSQISTDASTINYGVLPNTGNAQMKDINGQIKADIENDILPISNVQTKINVNGNQIQEHITSDSDYNIIDKSLELSFSDRLSLLDTITYSGMPLREHSMTAYEMLDDVIGSYGGYAKERPINWIKYQHESAIETQSESTTISVTTGTGWEIIGTPIKVVPNKKCSISYSITTETAYTEHIGQGIVVQILNSEPTDSDCTSLAIAYAFLSKEVDDNIGIIEFTPTTDTVYFVINFGWANSDQSILLTVNSLKVNGNSLSNSTINDKFLKPSAEALITNYYIGSRTSTIGEYLDEIKIEYPYLPSASYRETIEKFCNLAQITCALDNDGVLQFYDARPCYRNEEIIDVPKSYQISNLQKTLLLKNKYNGVDIKQDKVVVGLDVNSLIQTSETLAEDYSTNEHNQSVSDYVGDNASGYLEEYAKAYIVSYYTLVSFVIPKKKNQNKEKITHILSGIDNNGNANVRYVTTYTKKVGTATVGKGQSSTSIDDITLVETSSTTDSGDIPTSYTQKLKGIFNLNATATFDNLSTNTKQDIFTEDDDNYYVTLLLLCGGKFVGVNGSVSYASSQNEYLGESGQYEEYIPQKVEVYFYGDIYTFDFEEVDLSSPNIENATTIASVPTNELMQNAKNVADIKDNILYDYEKGVPTASVDLFCGLKDWQNGEIIDKGDIIRFADDVDKNGNVNLWRVTGRTFEYKGAPKLSLELQRQKCWHTIWTGNAKVDNISNGDFTESSTKTGVISLPISVDTSLTTAFVADVTFVRSDNTVMRTACGIMKAKASLLLTGTITNIICDLAMNNDGNQISYSADEVYKKVLSKTYKGYVKSINIIRIEQFY